MSDGHLTCPNCGADIEITEALSAEIRKGLESEFRTKLRQAETQLKQAQETFDQNLQKQLDEQARKLRADTEKAVTDRLSVEMKDLQARLDEQQGLVKKAQQEELELRKKARELEEAKQQQAVELERKLDAERNNLLDKARKQFEEQHHLKDLEQQQKIKDLHQALEDAKRKAEQGSMERQGEVLEVELEQVLQSAFPMDELEPVPKGIKGADLIQRVRSQVGQVCGVILWETKNTKTWNDNWIGKLKDDQMEVRANVSVLASRVLPASVEQFGYLDGIWICETGYSVALASVLRRHLQELNYVQLSSVGKNEKMEALYQYLSGSEFRQKMETIVETFTGMEAQLLREKRAMEKLWKEREKQIQRVIHNTAGLYGDLRGLIGATLPEIEQLELIGSDEPPQLPEG